MPQFPENIEYEINDSGILTLTIDLNKTAGISKSGKSKRIASTLGNKKLEHPDFSKVSIGINCYKPA